MEVTAFSRIYFLPCTPCAVGGFQKKANMNLPTKANTLFATRKNVPEDPPKRRGMDASRMKLFKEIAWSRIILSWTNKGRRAATLISEVNTTDS